MQYENISTHDIRQGDIVWMSGLRLRVVSEPRETNHPKNKHSPTLEADAIIENWDEVSGYVGNLSELDAEGNRTWRVQGNGLARWSREIPE